MTKRAVNQTCRQATGLRVQTLSSRVADYASNSAVERKKLIDDAVLIDDVIVNVDVCSC